MNPSSPGNQPTRTRPNDGPLTTVIRTERRSWITIAITAFGALLLKYLKIVRERGVSTNVHS